MINNSTRLQDLQLIVYFRTCVLRLAHNLHQVVPSFAWSAHKMSVEVKLVHHIHHYYLVMKFWWNMHTWVITYNSWLFLEQLPVEGSPTLCLSWSFQKTDWGKFRTLETKDKVKTLSYLCKDTEGRMPNDNPSYCVILKLSQLIWSLEISCKLSRWYLWFTHNFGSWNIAI